MCVAGSDAVFAVYSDAKGCGETAGSGSDMEEGVRGFGLVLFRDYLVYGNLRIQYARRAYLRTDAKGVLTVEPEWLLPAKAPSFKKHLNPPFGRGAVSK